MGNYNKFSFTMTGADTENKVEVFDFRSKSLGGSAGSLARLASLDVPTSPDTMVDMTHLTVETVVEKRARSQTCPEKMHPRFPKASPPGSASSNPSPRPGHYDPRMPKPRGPSPGHYDPRIRTMSAATPVFRHVSLGAKPAISHAQLVREAFICKTAQEMMKEFTSTVLDVKVLRGARVMWTSVPDDLKYIFNVTDIKTVDTWKQTMHGDVQLDVSMFQKGDKVKMSVQSIGVSGKHMHQPLVRGVPDFTAHPDTLRPSNANTPRVNRTRSRAGTLGDGAPLPYPMDELEEKHARFCAKVPVACNRFTRTGTLSDANKKAFTTNSMLPRSRTTTVGQEAEAKVTVQVPLVTAEG